MRNGGKDPRLLSSSFVCVCVCVCVCVFIFERETERQSGIRGGEDREGDTESEAGSRLQAVSTEPKMGLELTDPRDHDLSQSWMLN